VGANHQGNTWQYRCYERLCQLLTTAEIQAAKSATATAYQTSFEVIRAMWDLLAAIGFTGGSILEPACNTLWGKRGIRKKSYAKLETISLKAFQNYYFRRQSFLIKLF